jgi:microcystin-dependent protein
MAGLRISQLPLATAIASADVLPFSSISGSETRRIQANVLAVALGLLGTSVGGTTPLSPSNGQLWVDTSSNPPVLKVWNGATWTVVSFQPSKSVITNPAASAPTSPSLGQLWQDTSQTPDELKMWDGSNWVRVDPDGIDQTFADGRYLQITTAASTYLPLAGGTLTGNLTLVGAPTTNNMASTKKYVDDQIAALPAAAAGVPSGSIIWTASPTAPTGYLKANGAAVSRTTYADLFTAIGTLYGAGDGSTTFNLPDMRGEFARGWDDGRGVDSGRAFASSQAEMLGPHTHPVTDPGHSHSGSTGEDGGHSHTVVVSGAIQGSTASQINASIAADNTWSNFSTSSVGNHTHSISSGTTGVSVGSNTGTENRPRNVALLACIKT